MTQIMKGVGVAFRVDTLSKIDKERGLVGRSVWIRRIVEKYYENVTAGLPSGNHTSRRHKGTQKPRPARDASSDSNLRSTTAGAAR